MVKDCRWVVSHIRHVSHDSSALVLCVTYPSSILHVATVFLPFVSTEEEQGSKVDAGFATFLSPNLTPHCSPLTYLLPPSLVPLFLFHFDTLLDSLMLLSPDSEVPPALPPFSLPLTFLLTLIPHSPDSLTPLSSLSHHPLLVPLSPAWTPFSLSLLLGPLSLSPL